MTVEVETGATGTSVASFLFTNILASGTLTASTESADGAKENAIDDATWDYWLPTAVPATLVVDYGSDVECDCAGIAAHDSGSVGATVSVQSSPDGATWTTQGSFVPSDDNTLMIFFPAFTARYWRFRVTNAVALYGVVMIGKKLEMPVTPLSGHTSLHNAKRIELMNSGTDGGHFRGNRIMRRRAETTINFGAISATFADGDDFQLFKDHYNDGKPFFYAGCPLYYPEDVGYCWRPEGAGEIRPNYTEGGVLSEISMSVAAYL